MDGTARTAEGMGAGGGASFAVLGPLEVRLNGRPVGIGGQRLRTLLTLLLLDPGRTVATETLVAGVWRDDPPNGVGNALQALVSRLRTALGTTGDRSGPHMDDHSGDLVGSGPPVGSGAHRGDDMRDIGGRPGGPLRGRAGDAALERVGSTPQRAARAVSAAADRGIVVAEPSGYRLAVSPDEVDTYRFIRLAAAGRATLHAGDALAARATLRAALALWRGPALAELAGNEVAHAEVVRLEELRLAATEDRVEADLLLGYPGELMPELSRLIAAHPLRERLRGQLMRALYDSGRQVEALAAYEEARRTFAEHLGADPSPPLADLHASMLRQTPRSGQPRSGQPRSGQPTSRQPRSRQPVSPQPVSPQPVLDQPVSREPMSREPVSREPVSREPVSHEPVSHEPVSPQPVLRQPVSHEPVSRRPVSHRGVSHEPVSGQEVVAGRPVRGQPDEARTQTRQGNLRARLTSFVGREREVAQVCGFLDDRRLVTLVGPGGAGKTRLAVESADVIASRMPDGVWLVELAPVRDGSELPQAVLAALGVREMGLVPASARSGPPSRGEGLDLLSDPMTRLTTLLARRDTLLVLDNCEHVVEAAARLSDRILAECPGVAILATSREPLGITGETLFTVPPLGLPPPEPFGLEPTTREAPGSATREVPGSAAGGVPGSAAREAPGSAAREVPGSAAGGVPGSAARGVSGWEPSLGGELVSRERSPAVADGVHRYPAIRLFMDRAAVVRPGYQLRDLGAVVRICRALDGMPLAIELAAARLRSLSAEQIADRLGDRFRLLTGGSRIALPRHQTLRAVVGWSWDLLDEAELVLARRLAVFTGGAVLESAERVCAGEGLPEEEVLDVLARLVDKSLVVMEDLVVTESREGATRYRMLETILVYAAERLAEAGEEERLHEAHARHFLDLAETAEPHLRRDEQLRWLRVLSAEHDNLTEALRWAVHEGRVDLAVRYVGALIWYWWLLGHRVEGTRWCRDVVGLIARTEAEVDPHGLAMAHAGFAINAAGSGCEWEEVRASMEEAVRLVREHGARHPVAALAEPIASVFRGDIDTSRRIVGGLLNHPDPWVGAVALMFRAHLHINFGQMEMGEPDVIRALRIFREVGERWGIGTALSALSELHMLRGRFREAAEVLREALSLTMELRTEEDMPFVRSRLALALDRSGDRRGAEEQLREAERICLATRDEGNLAHVHHTRGEFARWDGDLETARGEYAEAEAIAGRVTSMAPQAISVMRLGLAYLAQADGDLARAARLLHEALRAAVESVDGPIIADNAVAWAGQAILEGDPVKAGRLLGAAHAVRGGGNPASHDCMRITEEAKAALGPRFEAEYERGRTMPRDEVVAQLGSGSAP